MIEVSIAFLVVLLALQGADVWTTNSIIAKGGVELNPVEAWCINKLGKAWWLPKVAGVTAGGVFAVVFLPAAIAAVTLGLLVGLYAWVVYHNAMQMKK